MGIEKEEYEQRSKKYQVIYVYPEEEKKSGCFRINGPYIKVIQIEEEFNESY